MQKNNEHDGEQNYKNTKKTKSNRGFSSFGKMKTKPENIIKIDTTNSDFIKSIRDIQLHDIKNLFNDVKNVFLQMNEEHISNVAQDKKLCAQITDFYSGYMKFNKNTEELDKISKQSIDAFRIITLGNKDETQIKDELNKCAKNSKSIVEYLVEQIHESKVLERVFFEEIKNQIGNKIGADYQNQIYYQILQDIARLQQSEQKDIKTAIKEVFENLTNEQKAKVEQKRLYTTYKNIYDAKKQLQEYIVEQDFEKILNDVYYDPDNVSYVKLVFDDIKRISMDNTILDADEKIRKMCDEFKSICDEISLLAQNSMARKGYVSKTDATKQIHENSLRIMTLTEQQIKFIDEILDNISELDGEYDLYDKQSLTQLDSEIFAKKSTILNQQKQIRESVERLESFSQGEQYKMKIQKSDLRELVVETLKKATAKDSKKQFEIKWSNDIAHMNEKRLAYYVETEPLIFKSILFNVASNAIKYCENKIDVQTIQSRNSISIFISDDGEGMTIEEADKAFFRGVQNKNAKQGSTGFGLSASEEMIRILGGGIEIVDPGPRGQGEKTTFKITIPTRYKHNKNI